MIPALRNYHKQLRAKWPMTFVGKRDLRTRSLWNIPILCIYIYIFIPASPTFSVFSLDNWWPMFYCQKELSLPLFAVHSCLQEHVKFTVISQTCQWCSKQFVFLIYCKRAGETLGRAWGTTERKRVRSRGYRRLKRVKEIGKDKIICQIF